jgi:hypothetical protein
MHLVMKWKIELWAIDFITFFLDRTVYERRKKCFPRRLLRDRSETKSQRQSLRSALRVDIIGKPGPAVFQGLINNVLRDVLNTFLFTWRTFELSLFHSTSSMSVMSCSAFWKKGVWAEKCEFHKEIVASLGYVITAGRVQTDCLKVKAVTDWLVRRLGVNCSDFWGLQTFTGGSSAIMVQWWLL